MNKTQSILALVALLALAAGPAAAQDRPVPARKVIYFGGSAGQSIFSESCQTLARPCDDTDFGWRGFAGYELNRRFAIEAGFADLGKVVSAGQEARTVLASDVSGLLHFPVLGNGSIFGRVGLFRARTKVSGEVESNTAWTYGAGVGYNLGFLGVRLEWQRWDNAGGGSTGEETINFLSVGGMLRF